MFSSDHWLQWEPAIRLAAFTGVFALLALSEVLAPRRGLTSPRIARWRTNLSLAFLGVIALRVASPITLIMVAVAAEQGGWGILHHWGLSHSVHVVLALVLLDLAIYWQHRLSHRLPWLWRLHRIHHSDVDFDLTTAVRFHPAELLVSFAVKVAAVVLLGAPALAVLVFEVVLSGAALFNHANFRLPERLDRIIRWLIVTPDMHRVHHSARDAEINRNFGFNLSCWDRLFASYCDHPADTHENMALGVPMANSLNQAQLWFLLKIPFVHESATRERS